MFKDLKNILILGLFVIIAILLLTKGCDNSVKINSKNDTIKTSDTIWAKDTVISFKTIYKPKYNTIYKIDTITKELEDSIFYVRKYNDSISDTNQTIYYNIKAIGFIDKLDLKYRLKIPIKIENNTTIIKKDTITKTPRFSIYSGLETGGNLSSFNLSPYIDFNFNNKTIGYRYGILDKTHNIKVGIRIFKSKK